MPITKRKFDQACDIIANTRKSRRTICKELRIAGESIDEYIKRVGEKAENQYARAKTQQAEKILDEIYEIEDQCKKELDNVTDPRKCNAIVQFYKLKIDNLKWILSKLLPKKYGEKLDLTSGGDKLPVPPSQITVKIAKNEDK